MRSQTQQKWASVSISRRLRKRIRAVLSFVADESLAEYARQAIQKRLIVDENAFEDQKMLETEIKERLDGDSL